MEDGEEEVMREITSCLGCGEVGMFGSQGPLPLRFPIRQVVASGG
jgi:hypothetical protein